jgi:hypothetical protein
MESAKLNKKEISKILQKYFGYWPTSSEIIFYEIKNYPKKEKEFDQNDAYEVAKEHSRQFPEFERPRFKIKTAKKQYIKKPKVKYISPIQSIKLISFSEEEIAEVEKVEKDHVRNQLLGILEWHRVRKVPVADEIKQLFNKYGIREEMECEMSILQKDL